MTVDLKQRASARQAMLSQKKTQTDVLAKRASARQAVVAELGQQVDLAKRSAARHAMLTRSDDSLEARAARRQAYLQGGPGNNDPKNLGFPGEIKYPRMEVPVGGDARQWEQQWFEGAAAETKPNMGPAGAELELKKKLQRAQTNVAALDKTGGSKLAAAKVAHELDQIVIDLDKAGYVKEAQEAEEVLEELTEFIAKPDEEKTEGELTASAREELVKLATELDEKGYHAEASEIDALLGVK